MRHGGNAIDVDDRILHRDFNPLPLAGLQFLHIGTQNTQGSM
jgi:hypothetical protein